MTKYLKVLILLGALTVPGLGVGRADDKILVTLYLGENTPPPPHAAIAPEPLRQGLQTVFGFANYQRIKTHEIELSRHAEQWVVPRKDLSIRFLPLPPLPGQPQTIGLEIYKDGFIVARGRYEPHQGTPLFINGPDFHQGRFIFVLEPTP